jgi:spore germination protein GerM
MESQELSIFSSINPGVILQQLTINEEGVAHADFSPELDRQVGGSCRVQAIRAQIENTLLEFPTVNDVVISINGRTEDILQP